MANEPTTNDNDTFDFEIDLQHLTISELEEIEEKSGLPIDVLADPKRPKAKMMRAVAYVLRRRDNPAFTWEDAGSLRISFGESPPVVPTIAASE